MTVALPAPPLLVVTDRLSAYGDLSDVVTDVLSAGCRWLMVREKDLATADLGALAKEIVDMGRPFDAVVTVNGDMSAAEFACAAGIHVQGAAQVRPARSRLGNKAMIGVSAHTAVEAQAAAEEGADYVTISPVFLTESKPGYGPALGLETLGQICRQQEIPVVALAGITPQTAGLCLDNGAAAVAVMGAVMRSHNPGSMVREILRSIRRKAHTD